MKQVLLIVFSMIFINIHAQDSAKKTEFVMLPDTIIKALHDKTEQTIIIKEKQMTDELRSIVSPALPNRRYSFLQDWNTGCDDCTVTTITFLLKKGDYVFDIITVGGGLNISPDDGTHLIIYNYKIPGAKRFQYKIKYQTPMLKPKDLIKASEGANFIFEYD